MKLQGVNLHGLMDRFFTFFSSNIQNLVSAFRHGNCRHGPLDNILELKKNCPYDYIQYNVFPCQGFPKVYLFKMSPRGKGNGVDLVSCMQLGGDLQGVWLIFYHCRRVSGWTTMACHVYDPNYAMVMIVAICDMQLEDVQSQVFMWKVMKANGVHMPQFKGFMANNVQPNWNVVQMVFGPSGNPSQPLPNKGCLNLSFPLGLVYGNSH